MNTPRYAIIHTTLSGLLDFKRDPGAEGQPHLAYFAAIVVDENLNKARNIDMAVEPAGWSMSEEETVRTGITTEWLVENGLPLSEVLQAYESLIESGLGIYAFNTRAHLGVLQAGLRSFGQDDLQAKTRELCVMQAAHSLGIKNENGRGWPAFDHVLRHFKIDVPSVRTAPVNAFLCLRVLRRMREEFTVPEPVVRPAKSTAAA